MKTEKKVFICAMLVLMLFLCINAGSAAEPLDDALGADIADELAINDVSSEPLSASGDRYVVDGIGEGGNYKNISAAVSAATGGETIFIKNGTYTESARIELPANKPLSFIGESKGGVIITSTANNGLIYNTNSGSALVFKNLTFNNIGAGNFASLYLAGDSSIDIIDCNFNGCGGKWGSVYVYTSDVATIDNCNILNSKATAGSGSAAIGIAGSGTTIIKNTVINNTQYTGTSGYASGVIATTVATAVANLDNVTIANSNIIGNGIIYTRSNMAIKNSKIINNTLNPLSSGYQGDSIIFVGANSNYKGNLTIEQSVISDNKCTAGVFLKTNAAAAELTMNYNNIHDNSFSTTITTGSGTLNLDANYWGSNTLPDGVTANTWVVENNGVYTLNDGSTPLAKDIPGLTGQGGQQPVDNTRIYVSVDGTGDGSSYPTPMSDFNQALDVVPDGGTIYILNGQYDIASPIMVNKNVSFVGESRDGVIMSCSANAGLFLIGYDMDTFSDLHLGAVSISDITFANYDNLVAYTYSSVNEFNITNCIINVDDDDLTFIQMGIDTMWSPSCGGTFNFKNNVVTSNRTSILIYGAFNANINDNILNCTIGNYTSGTINADYNYWGTPQTLTLNNWINFTAGTTTPQIYTDESATISIATTLNDGVTDASSHLPDYPITATLSAAGTLSDDSVTLLNGAKDVTYSSATPISDTVNINILGQSLTVSITVNERYAGIIYVNGETGNDANDGSENAKVKTLSKAIELADMGIGKIIVDAGTYTIDSTLSIAKDLDIAGVGDVVINGNSKKIIENTANLNLTNLKFTGGSASDACVLSNKGNATLQSCEVYSNVYESTYAGSIIRNNAQSNTLIINDTKFHDNSAGYPIIQNTKGKVIINNSEVYDNDFSSRGSYGYVVYNAGGNVTVQNTIVKNNKGKKGAIYTLSNGYGSSKTYGEVNILNTTFDSNVAVDLNGGVIFAEDSDVTISDSRFINNTARNDNGYSNGKGGAIYINSGNVTIDGSIFVNNKAVDQGNDLFVNGGKLNMANSVLVNSNNGYSVVKSNSPTIDVNDNFWGDNTKANVGSGITVDRWVILNAAYSPGDVSEGDLITITASFNQTNSSAGVSDYAGKIPDGVNVTFSSTTGEIAVVSTEDGSASATYNVDIGDNVIVAASGNAAVEMPINVLAFTGTIYVSPTGNDNNNGLTEASAVKTIAHAIELADASTGKIILLEGTHVIDAMLEPTKDLDITGIGVAIIDGNQKRIIQTKANLNLTNIQFTNGYIASSNLINLMSGSASCLSLNNVKFYNNIAKYGVAAQTGTRLIINNSEFYDNDFTTASNSNGMVYINSADAIIENTVFNNNKCKAATAIAISRATSASTGSLIMNNVTVSNNFANAGNGILAITGTNTVVEVNNSKFLNNFAAKGSYGGGSGGAIYMAANQGTLTVDQCVFINNTGNYEYSLDTGIYANKGTVDVTNSVLLGNATTENCIVNYENGATVTAENNWWGNNDQANTNVNVNNIVKMTATLDPADAQAGDAVIITVAFDNDKLPKDVINVSFTSTSGSLNEVVTMDGAQASVNYAGDASDLSISVKSSQAEAVFSFDPEAGIVFVLPGADDSNPGTRTAPVGTIAHALEIANGQIVLLEGTHKTGDLGVISSDLTIAGEGNAIIDAQSSNRILSVDSNAKVVISNVTMINGYSADASGALIYNENELTLINCTLANSSAPNNNAGAIFSTGKLTIINTTIANCSAIQGGAIYTQTFDAGVSITAINSTFENNVATGNTRFGGGAIFAYRTTGYYQTFDLTIDNSTFKDNEAQGTSSGGAIHLEQLDSTVKITDSEFISNHANGNGDYGGGAIYTSCGSLYYKAGTMTITGTLFENNTCDSNGGAIFAKTTTVSIESSVLINNSDANGVAIYGYKTEQANPAVTLNDNWWGSNDSPKDLVGGNSYNPTLSRWAILTITNETPIVAGETVKLIVSINNYTTGTENGTMANPIKVKRGMTLSLNNNEIPLTLEDGVATYDYTVPADAKYIATTVDGETTILYVVSSQVTIEVADIDAKKYEKVHVEINVASDDTVNAGQVQLYVNGAKLIATIDVVDGKAIGDVVISENDGSYNLTAKYVNGAPLFDDNEKNATLTVSGTVELTNTTFFNFFDNDGILRDEIAEEELVFHGDFGGLGVDIITIPRSISIKGDDATLYDMALSIQSGNSKVEDMKLIADGADFVLNGGAAILAFGENIELNNVTVNFTTPSNSDAHAVYASYANNFKLIDSTIIFDSNNAGAVQHAVHITDSDNINVAGNTINASLPARLVDWHSTEPYVGSIDQDTVLAIGIQGGSGGVLTENEINVETKTASLGYGPTVDAVMIYGVNNFEISWNNITLVDLVNPGTGTCIYAVDLYAFDEITVKYNNIITNSTGGLPASGTSYPIQATGSYDALIIDHNNLTSISKGPALGIYSSVGYTVNPIPHVTDITVTFNNINVTGYATVGYDGTVSGIELQDTVARAYNNTIYSQSIGSYDNANQLYGISYSQSAQGTHSYDIKDNTVNTDGKYAVYFFGAANSNVTDNTLYAHELYGDDSVNISSGENNVIRDNMPPFDVEINITADNVWIGSGSTVTVNITGATGTVTIKVNEKEFKDLVLTEGFVSQIVDAADLIVGENKVNVTFTSSNPLIKSGEANTAFWVLDGVVTQDNYMFYFNQDDNGKFFDYVPEGVTLDFQGSIINPDKTNIVQMNVNKPVNIITTTGDGYIDLNTTSRSLLGDSPGNSFAITRGGSGTNVTGIRFHNTQIWISNTTNVVLDNISNVIEDQSVGSGVGATSVRDNSTYVTVKNSYFYTRNNGGSTTTTLSHASYCTFDNNTIKIEGNVGNGFYLNPYNVANVPMAQVVNNYNNITNNRIYGKPGGGISQGIVIWGSYNLFKNNTLYNCSVANPFIMGGTNPSCNNTFIGNVFVGGGSLTAQPNSIMYDNNVTGSLTTGTGSTAYNNTVVKDITSGADAIVYNNTVGGALSVAAGAHVYNNTVASLKTSGANSVIEENIIEGAVTIGHKNTTFANNNVSGLVTVNADENRIIENIIITTVDYTVDLKAKKNNNVTDNILYARELIGDASVHYTDESNIVKDNYPVKAEVFVEATNVFVGQASAATTITVTVPGATGNVTIRVNGKETTVNLTKGVATFETDEYANNYTVNVTYNGDIKYLSNTNVTTFKVLDNVVVNDTFYCYFDETGILRDEVPYDELIFEGEFADLVSYITVNRALTITGSDAELTDIGFIIAYNDVKLDNMTLVANIDLGNLIDIAGENAVISNMNITYVVSYYANVINVYPGANGAQILNNTIYFESTVDDYSVDEVTNAICVDSGTDVFSDEDPITGLVIDGNNITVVIPAFLCDVYENEYYVMGLSAVNGVRINGAEDFEFTNNNLDVTTNRLARTTPTFQAMYVASSSGLVDGNNISMIDTFTPAGKDVYLHGILLINDEELTISSNNFNLSTTGGKDEAGSAYAIVAISSEFEIIKNNITTVSNGPNLAVYFPSRMGAPCEAVISGNFINVTGLATGAHDAGLVSGIEIQTGDVVINENTIYAYNIGEYAEGNYIYGISYAQRGSTPEVEIKDNTIYTEGHYAISFLEVDDAEITDNYLVSTDLYGDAAVEIKDGEGNVVEDNYPVKPDVIVEATDVFKGQNTTITVTVAGATGNVTIRLNGRDVTTVNLTNGVATFETDAYGDNQTVNVTYNGDAKHYANTNVTNINFYGNVVTNDTFYTYFDEAGILRDEVNHDELIFEGEFSDLGAGYVILTKPVKITGHDAVLTNLGIVISSDDVALDNLTLNATTALGDLIGVYASNVNITNMNISYVVNNESAIAINVLSASNVNIKDNEIYFESHVAEEGENAIAVNVESATNVVVDHNDIKSNLAGVDSNYALYYAYGMMGVDTVNPIRVNSSSTVKITNNKLDASLNAIEGYYPTIQTSIILGSSDVLIDGNNVTMIDAITPVGKESYLYGFVFGFVEDTTVSNNNFYMYTDGGVNAKGSAYAINIVRSDIDIVGNNITSVSNGPNLGIYVAMSYDTDHMLDEFEVNIKDNNIDVTGYASSKSSAALLSGIEVGAGEVTITGNNITVNNKAGYVEKAPVHGISYVQSMWKPIIDIEDNNIFVEDGDYAISINFGRGTETTADNNFIIAHELYGDDAVYVKDMDDSEVKDNRPYDPQISIEVDNITVGEKAIINITTDENAIGVVTAIVNGEQYVVDMDAGFGQITVSDLTASDYTVTAKFTSADVNWGDGDNITVFNVAKLDTEMSISIDADAKLGDDANITVSIPGATGEVVIIVNGKEEKVQLDENGNATYTIEDIAADDYYVTVIYAGDDEHAFAYNKTSFTIDRLESEVTVTVEPEVKVGENTTITVNVTEGATGTVTVSINGTEATFDISQGEGIIVALPEAGEYSVIATYNGDEKYNVSVSEAKTIVVSEKTPANISVELPEDIKVGDNITIKVSASTDAELTVFINGEAQTIIPANVPLGVSLMSILKAEVGRVDYTVDHYGIYNITVTAKENEEYASEVFTKIFEVTKNDAVLEIAPITDAKINDTISISVANETDGALTIKVNGEEVTGDYVISKAGAYTITVESAATDAYNAGFATYTFEVPEEVIPPKEIVDADITVPGDVKVGEDALVEVSIPNATGLVSVIVDGVESIVELDENGTAVVPIENVTAGNHSVVVIYSGDETHAATYGVSSFNVPEEVIPPKEIVDADITVPGDVKVGEDALVEVSIPNATGLVSVIVDGVESIVELDENGTAVVPIKNVTSGNHSVVVIYSGDETHAATYGTSNFTVEEAVPVKTDANIALDVGTNENNVTFTVVVDDDATGIVRFDISGAEEYSLYLDVVSGRAVLEDVLEAGDYTVVATYMGDDRFNANVATESFTVKGHVKQDTPIEAYAFVNGNIVTVFVNVNENATGFVRVEIGDSSVFLELAGGVGSVVNTLPAGSYNVDLTYLGDNDFNGNSTSVSFNVVDVAKENTTISIDVASVENNVTYTVELNENATGIVRFDVSGAEKYAVYADVIDGKAVLEDVLEAGDYTVVATYLGDGRYNTNITSASFTVKGHVKQDTPIEASVIVNGYRAAIVVKVNENATGFVRIELGDTVANIELADGVGSLVTTLNAGSYHADLTYLGDYNFNENSTVELFTIVDVEKQNTTIGLDVVIAEGNVTYAVAVDENATGIVKFEVTGAEEYTLYVDVVNGKAVLEDVLNAGNYTVIATYMGDSRFNTNMTSFDFAIEVPEKQVADVSINMPSEINAGENTAVEISIPNATGNVIVIVDGVETVVPLDENGTAVVPIENITAGDHSVVVIYQGDDKFASIYKSIPFSVAEEANDNVTVVVDGVEYPGKIVNGTVVIDTGAVVPDDNVTVVVDGVEYPGKIVNGTVVIDTNATEPDNNVTVVVDGVEYPGEIVDGKVTIKTNATEPGLPETVIVDGVEYPVEVVNGTLVVKTNATEPDNKVTVIVDGVEYPAEVVDGKVTIKTNATEPVTTERLGTVLIADDFEQYSCDHTVGERGRNFTGQLVDSNGVPLANKVILIGYNGINFNRTTNATGHFAVQIGLQNAGLYTFAMSFLDDAQYNASFLVKGINIVKKPTSIVAKNTKFKAKTKTKKLTVKLETILGASVDGKIYLKEGKKLTLTVNGKTFKAKTDADGKATFKITNLNKKGKYKAKIKFSGDNYVYKGSKAKIKITVK